MVKKHRIDEYFLWRRISLIVYIDDQALNGLSMQIVDDVLTLHTMIWNVEHIALVFSSKHETEEPEFFLLRNKF